MSDRRVGWSLIVGAILARAALVLALGSHEIPRSTYEHGEIAENLLAGRGFSVKFLGAEGPTSQQAPLYPVIVAGAYALGGGATPRSLLILELGQAILGGCLVASVMAFVREILSGRSSLWPARIAGFVAAFHPTLLYAATHVQVAMCATLFLTLSLAQGYRTARTGRARDAILSGFWLGVLMLTDPILGLASMGVAWAILQGEPRAVSSETAPRWLSLGKSFKSWHWLDSRVVRIPARIRGILGATGRTRPVSQLCGWPSAVVSPHWPSTASGTQIANGDRHPEIHQEPKTLRVDGARVPVLPLRRRFGLVAIVAATSLVVLLPWTIRNYRVHGEFVAVKSTFGYAFWQGNCALSEGTDKVVRPSVDRALKPSASSLKDWNRALWKARHEAGYLDDIALTKADYAMLAGVSEPERSRILFRRAMADLRAEPSRYITLTLRRLRYFVFFDETNPKTRSLVYRASHLGLTFFALLGVALMPRETRRRLGPTFLTACLIAGFHSLTIVSARFHLPIEPLLAIWGALAFARAGNTRVGEPLGRLAHPSNRFKEIGDSTPASGDVVGVGVHGRFIPRVPD